VSVEESAWQDVASCHALVKRYGSATAVSGVSLWLPRKRIRHYSQGMRQRLALACALVNRPDLLILDEPTNGLDPAGIRWVRYLVQEERDRGTCVLVSSHQLDEVARICDRVIVLVSGRSPPVGPGRNWVWPALTGPCWRSGSWACPRRRSSDDPDRPHRVPPLAVPPGDVGAAVALFGAVWGSRYRSLTRFAPDTGEQVGIAAHDVGIALVVLAGYALAAVITAALLRGPVPTLFAGLVVATVINTFARLTGVNDWLPGGVVADLMGFQYQHGVWDHFWPSATDSGIPVAVRAVVLAGLVAAGLALAWRRVTEREALA
jgi:energy-coupling factor transporter ATP-binding protein EcfA2